MKELHLKIYGGVQGVNFRYNARKKAQSLGLTGFVRNLPDGTVEMVAQGEEQNLLKLLNWCHEGPRLAHVERIEEGWQKPETNFDNFQIKY